MKKIFAALFVILFSAILSACVPNIGTKTKAPTVGEFVKGDVVKGFPENLPLPKNAQTIESYGSKEAFGASFISSDDLAKAVNFYNASLAQLGWQSTLTQSSETNYIFAIKNDTHSGTVTVNLASDGKKTAITMEVVMR